MEGFVSQTQSLQALSALLSTQQEEEEEESKKVTIFTQLGPGHIGPPPTKDKDVTTAYVKRNNKDIWSEEGVADSCSDDLTDLRPQPEYEMILKQSVGTEDVFLGLSRRNPSSMCCEAMLVKIKLPDTEVTDVVLEVKEKFLDLRTPKHKLGLHLPNAVHSHKGRAQFFSGREELEVTLFLKWPMDLINMR
ncbi:dynein axonemal assembly factor 6-like [Limanda limanda]|uniref:dynein axonemal assembly factor 6-like n=1 Tax=Limanda limanda TaxID=27771 RepID=UPI0029C9A1D8|nr:dynein axonemal assembly factor 6-like [Limanda limanda]